MSNEDLLALRGYQESGYHDDDELLYGDHGPRLDGLAHTDNRYEDGSDDGWAPPRTWRREYRLYE